MHLDSLQIENLELIDTRKKTQLKAIFDLKIAGLGVVRECRYIVRPDGRGTVYGPSVQAAHGGFPKFFVLEPDAADHVTHLVATKYDEVTG